MLASRMLHAAEVLLPWPAESHMQVLHPSLHFQEVPTAWKVPFSKHPPASVSASAGGAVLPSETAHPIAVLRIESGASHVQVLHPSLHFQEVPTAWVVPLSTHDPASLPPSVAASPGGVVLPSETLHAAAVLRRDPGASHAQVLHPSLHFQEVPTAWVVPPSSQDPPDVELHAPSAALTAATMAKVHVVRAR